MEALLKEQIMINQFVSAAGCNADQARQILLKTHWQFEYLNLRFNRPTRILGSLMFCIYAVNYLGIVLYAPALALNAVTGLSLWGSVFSVGVICTIYTTIGGMKAVLWTDTFQVCLMMVGFVVVLVGGTINVGGIGRAWEIAQEGQRLELWVWDTDVTVRHTIWGVVIGGFIQWTMTYGVNQAQVQRYLTCSSLKTARIAVGLAIVFMTFFMLVPSITGIVIYANYADCDPKSIGLITNFDQLMPYFIMDLFGHVPGLAGLLTAAIFSASLSTISSGLNALAAVAGEDFVKAKWPSMKERTYTWVSKGLACSFGVLTMFLSLMASTLGEILQTSNALASMFSGPILGLYCAGFFLPWINSKGAFTGACVGLVLSCWLGIGAQIYPYPPDDPPLSIAGCPVDNSTVYSTHGPGYTLYDNLTTIADIDVDNDRPAIANMYKLSYTWWGASSWLLTLMVANIVSFLTGLQDPKKLDPRLICPLVDTMYCCLPERWKKPLRCGVGEEYEEQKVDYQDCVVMAQMDGDEEKDDLTKKRNPTSEVAI